MYKKYTVDQTTIATNPGKIELNPLVWLRHNFLQTFPFSILPIVTSGLSLLGYNGFIGITVILLVLSFYYWRRKYEHFKYGDSNGGVVISNEPTLIAVRTDLSKGIGHYPVIKIIKYNRRLPLGEKIGTVAIYNSTGNDDDPFWLDFSPIPINYATDNQDAIELAVRSYSEEDWKMLNGGIQQIPSPYQAGTYKIKEDNCDWLQNSSQHAVTAMAHLF